MALPGQVEAYCHDCRQWWKGWGCPTCKEWREKEEEEERLAAEAQWKFEVEEVERKEAERKAAEKKKDGK